MTLKAEPVSRVSLPLPVPMPASSSSGVSESTVHTRPLLSHCCGQGGVGRLEVQQQSWPVVPDQGDVPLPSLPAPLPLHHGASCCNPLAPDPDMDLPSSRTPPTS
jgi:hypothetical protein